MRISHDAESRFALDAVHVSVLIAGGSGDEGDVDLEIPFDDGAHPSSVTVHDDGIFQGAVGHRLGDGTGQVIRVDPGDHAVLDVLNERRVNGKDPGHGDLQALQSHPGRFVQHQVQDAVAVPQTVMKRNRHAIRQSAGQNRLADRSQQLVLTGADGNNPRGDPRGAALLHFGAGKGFHPAISFDIGWNFTADCILHFFFSSFFDAHDAFATVSAHRTGLPVCVFD